MKNIFIKALAGVMLTAGATSCGDKFLETDIYNDVDLDTGLSTPTSIGYALNGAYYRLSQYYFSGNYANNIGDIMSDITYWNGKTNHFNSLYSCTYVDTDIYLSYIWQDGYKVVDNSARILKAIDELLPEANAADAAELQRYKAEAHALRAYAMLYMTNIYGHQVKVNGQDFSNELGVVVVNEPVEAFAEVKRNSVGECYTQILSDLNASLTAFQAAGEWSNEKVVFTPASVYGVMARTKLYLEDWAGAADAAKNALSAAGISSVASTEAAYDALYQSTYSNSESLFYLALDVKTNWSANSCGTLYTTYNYSPSPYLMSLYGENDIRTSIFNWTVEGGTEYAPYGATTPIFGGGKFGFGNFDQVRGGNPAVQTTYLINAPEMFLIQAEAAVKQNDVNTAKAALFTVAKRNQDITSVNDLPGTADALMSFIQDERARELFQEGHRLWDLRRWGKTTNLYAYDAPNVNYMFKNIVVSDVILPIPDSEINAGFGVEQTPNWAATRPQ